MKTFHFSLFVLIGLLSTTSAQSIVDDFSQAKFEARVAERGDWKFENRIASCASDPELYKTFKNHGPILKWPFANGFTDGSAEFEMKAQDCQRVVFTFNGDGHIFRVTLADETLSATAGPSKVPTRLIAWAEKSSKQNKGDTIEPEGLPDLPAINGKWVKVKIEVTGKTADLTIGKFRTKLKHAALARNKNMTMLTFAHGTLAVRNFMFSVPPKSKPNVLMIAIDDLNDWVGCLEGHPQARSPNIDRLAKRGTLFTNAHCQAPICNPSRTSIMYGLRPSTSGVYMNSPRPWTVNQLKPRVTLPRHFAANGYQTYTTGKIYHGSGLPEGDFDVVGPRGGQKNKLDKRLIPPTENGAKGLWDFGPQTYEEKFFQDHQSASWAIEQINSQKVGQDAQPFFMTVGFYRPHVPFYSPQRVFDQIPLEEIALPKVKEGDRDDLPPIASELMTAFVAPDHAWFVESGKWREAVQSYLSCIRYTDEQVGRLLDALDASPSAKNTIVILYSDHGFFLGEKERWAKQSLWERATRVPFIVVAPGMKSGQECPQPTELLSIYPTLIELCGLSNREGLEGRSLAPLLKNSQQAWPHVALTTHGKDNHSVRTRTHRYIRYRDGSEELYDLRTDPNEWTNIAGDPAQTKLKKELAKSFPANNAEPAKGTNRTPKTKTETKEVTWKPNL